MNNMNELQPLHEDLIIEILSWLPVKSVVRCICVCKSWRSIIQDRKFIIEKHMLRGKLDPLTPEEGSSFKIVEHIHGLNLEFCDTNDIYRIRNNATNKVLSIHNPNMDRYYSMIMDYVPSTNEYKVQYLYWKGATTGMGMKLLTIGHQNIWRSVEIPFFDYRKVIATMGYHDGVSYILYSSNLAKAKMIKFQFEDESFMEILTPKGVPLVTSDKKFRFLKWDKNISIGCLVKETLHVWILEDLKKSNWEERKIVFPSNFLVHHHDMFEKFDPHCVVGCWLFLLLDNRNKWLPYNIETKRIARVSNCRYARNSIQSLKGMQ